MFQELIRSRLGQYVRALEQEPPEGSMREAVEGVLVPLVEQIRVTRMGDLLRLVIAESGRFPELAEFYYREVVQRAMSAIARRALQAVRSGEVAGSELARFPQILSAPVVLTFVWSTLFERIAPLDGKALLAVYLDLVFGPKRAKRVEAVSVRKPPLARRSK